MKRFLLGLVLLLVLDGCSIAAAAAGANSDTVSSLADLDGLLVGGLASAIGGALASATQDANGPPPTPEDAHMCWLDDDGGVEIYGLDEAHAEALCRARWGENAVCRCEWIGGRAR